MKLTRRYANCLPTVESLAVPSGVESEVLQLIGSNREDHRRDRSTVMLCARPR